MDDLIEWLLFRIQMYDDGGYEFLNLSSEDLQGYDPDDVCRELARRTPYMTYAWQPCDDEECAQYDDADCGKLLFDSNQGYEHLCIDCLPDTELVWTNFIHTPCSEHA